MSGDPETFRVGHDLASETKQCRWKTFESNLGEQLTLIDTMGLCDTDDDGAVTREKISEALWMTKDGVDVVLFCMKQARLNDEQYDAFQAIYNSILGEKCRQHMVLVITHCKNEHILKKDIGSEWLEQQKKLTSVKTGARFREIVKACDGRVVMMSIPANSNYQKEQRIIEKVRRKSRRRLFEMLRQVSPEKEFVPDLVLRTLERPSSMKVENEPSVTNDPEKKAKFKENLNKLLQNEPEKPVNKENWFWKFVKKVKLF